MSPTALTTLLHPPLLLETCRTRWHLIAKQGRPEDSGMCSQTICLDSPGILPQIRESQAEAKNNDWPMGHLGLMGGLNLESEKNSRPSLLQLTFSGSLKTVSCLCAPGEWRAILVDIWGPFQLCESRCLTPEYWLWGSSHKSVSYELRTHHVNVHWKCWKDGDITTKGSIKPAETVSWPVLWAEHPWPPILTITKDPGVVCRF